MTWSDNDESLEAEAVMEGVTMELDRGWPEMLSWKQNVIAHIKKKMLSWRLQVICEKSMH